MGTNKNLYLNKIQLQAELDRCLSCKAQPCMKACPVGCNPQEFIALAKSGKTQEAVQSIMDKNILGETCGLVCPDQFCMKACTRRHIDFAINIPKVQATILQNYRQNKEAFTAVTDNGLKVAVVGAGPAGLSAAAELARAGCKVDLFEAENKIGGAVNLIPEERLPRDVIEKDWSYVFNPERVTLKLNTPVDNLSVLADSYDWVVVSTGEHNVMELKIPGGEYALSYIEYLKNPQKYQTAGRVAVIGGGNVAVDCALTAKAQGASGVEMFVRRRLADMRITEAEHLELLRCEIDISPLTSPVKIEQAGDKYVMTICKNKVAEGKACALDSTEIKLPSFDLIIKAVGSRADEKTEHEKIIYAGDCQTGGSTVVQAVASGRVAARKILEKAA